MKTSAHVRLMLVAVLCVVMLVGMGGCRTKKQGPVTIPQTPTGGNETTSGNGLPETPAGTEWLPATDMQKVYFDYNSYTLRPDGIKALTGNADKMKANAGKTYQVEGHCDERGTQEYNLALGEKRALAVREYLIKLGVSGDRIVTISYGKERPAAQGHDESAWKQNRRCEFNVSK